MFWNRSVLLDKQPSGEWSDARGKAHQTIFKHGREYFGLISICFDCLTQKFLPDAFTIHLGIAAQVRRNFSNSHPDHSLAKAHDADYGWQKQESDCKNMKSPVKIFATNLVLFSDYKPLLLLRNLCNFWDIKIRSWKVSCSIFLLFVSPLVLLNRFSVYCIVFLLSPLSSFSYGVLFGLYPALRRVNEFDRSVTGFISFCVKISTSVYL